MEISYQNQAKLLKVMADPGRLKIMDILSCGELCANDILENFDFSQPTLSHHMKLLADAGLVKIRKCGVRMYYSIDTETCSQVIKGISAIFNPSENCICRIAEPKYKNLLLVGEE